MDNREVIDDGYKFDDTITIYKKRERVEDFKNDSFILSTKNQILILERFNKYTKFDTFKAIKNEMETVNQILLITRTINYLNRINNNIIETILDSEKNIRELIKYKSLLNNINELKEIIDNNQITDDEREIIENENSGKRVKFSNRDKEIEYQKNLKAIRKKISILDKNTEKLKNLEQQLNGLVNRIKILLTTEGSKLREAFPKQGKALSDNPKKTWILLNVLKGKFEIKWSKDMLKFRIDIPYIKSSESRISPVPHIYEKSKIEILPIHGNVVTKNITKEERETVLDFNIDNLNMDNIVFEDVFNTYRNFYEYSISESLEQLSQTTIRQYYSKYKWFLFIKYKFNSRVFEMFDAIINDKFLRYLEQPFQPYNITLKFMKEYPIYKNLDPYYAYLGKINEKIVPPYKNIPINENQKKSLESKNIVFNIDYKLNLEIAYNTAFNTIKNIGENQYAPLINIIYPIFSLPFITPEDIRGSNEWEAIIKPELKIIMNNLYSLLYNKFNYKLVHKTYMDMICKIINYQIPNLVLNTKYIPNEKPKEFGLNDLTNTSPIFTLQAKMIGTITLYYQFYTGNIQVWERPPEIPEQPPEIFFRRPPSGYPPNPYYYRPPQSSSEEVNEYKYNLYYYKYDYGFIEKIKENILLNFTNFFRELKIYNYNEEYLELYIDSIINGFKWLSRYRDFFLSAYYRHLFSINITSKNITYGKFLILYRKIFNYVNSHKNFNKNEVHEIIGNSLENDINNVSGTLLTDINYKYLSQENNNFMVELKQINLNNDKAFFNLIKSMGCCNE